MSSFRSDSSPKWVYGCLVLIALGFGCSKADPPADKSRRGKAVPVTIATVVQKDMPLEVDTFGTAQSKASVTIKAKVTQAIQEVHFKEGDLIPRGGLLFTLDSRPYRVALEQARAALSRDKTLAAGAQVDLQRATRLLEEKLLAQSEFDKVKTNSDSLLETAKVDQAAIDAAQINLDNCRITSPIEGRAGKVLVHAGNLVNANDTALVMINQIKPMDVYFSLPQAELDRVRSYQAKGQLEVSVAIPDDPGHPMKGPLTFLNNLVDTSNGTIELGATLPNQDERLWPGRYVLVHLALTVQHGVLVVPTKAVVTSSLGQSVFVVKKDRTVEQRMIKVDRARGEETVIASGLEASELVVTDGQLQLEDGTPVEVNSSEANTATPGQDDKGANP
jgi:membrane fusion protein, multidrug efflux system